MSIYSIEFSKEAQSCACDRCGEESLTVWGWISKDRAAHAVYFATLMTGQHDDVSVRLTISFGGWGESADPNAKHWCFMEVQPTEDSCAMMVREPEESHFHDKSLLGTPMTRAAVLDSSLREEFFTLADLIVIEDAAVRSYLAGEEVSVADRELLVTEQWQ